MDTIYNFSSIVKTKDGKTYPINQTNTLSASYTANSSNASDIVLGYAAAASFKASLNNLDRFWDSVMLKGAELQLNITGGLEGYSLGIFDIEEVRKNEGCINIESIDRMVLFDVKFMGATFPCTVGHLVQVLCDQVGIPLATPVFPNSEVSIKKGEDFKGVSCRVILTSCMEVAGSFAMLNAEGKLEIKWYDITNIVDTFSYSQMSNFTPEENPVEITGVRFETADDTFVAGNDGFPLDIPSNNPILKSADEPIINEVLNVIYQQRVKNMAYLPCSFDVPSKPALRPGDVVKTIDKRKREALALITEITFTDNIGVKVVSCGKAKAQTKGYTKGYSEAQTGDVGDKIGFVLGYNTAAYTFTDSAQTVAACALGLDVETRVDVQLVGTYQFTPAAPSTLSIVGDVTGTTEENITGTINSSDPTKITGTATGTVTGELTGTGTLNDASPPLVIIEYRVNGVTQMTFYQYPHPGMNTFSAAFIPSAQKPGTASIDLRFTIAGGTISFEKREANISLLVKNGDVVDTPPWPEINISQVFSPIIIEDNGELITIADLAENVITGVQMPVGGLIQEVFEGITIEDSEPVQVGVFNDNLVIDRVIGGEIFRFNTQYADMYNYSTKYVAVTADSFKEQDTYKFVGVEKPIDTGLMVEVSLSTDEFKNVNSIEVEVK